MKAYRRLPLALSLVLLFGAFPLAGGDRPAVAAASHPFADGAFDLIWSRTDAAVAAQSIVRGWIWGPGPGVAGLEPYRDAPGGVRLVQYFDKGRMEINDPRADPAGPWFTTNGLLTVELMTGRMQTGDTTYEQRAPAALPLAGDTNDANAPTYAAFLGVSNTPLGEHRQPDRRGQVVTDVINRAGAVSVDPSKSAYLGLRVVQYDTRTGHNIPEIFWLYLNQTGPVQEGGATRTAPLFASWVATFGLPISDAYWARVLVAGRPEDVLVQAFERRVLTYQPSAPAGWRVQMGNIGLHYYQWRYGASWYDGRIGPQSRPAADPGLPVQLVIPKLGVRANVEQVGQDSKGNMAVPQNPWDVGWYAPGTRPGAAGNAALDGHLDWYHIGPVVFWNLHTLAPGDMVYVRDDTGRDRAFRVAANTQCPWNACPLREIFGPFARPRLNLITCQGTFNRASANYDHRQVVYTDLVQ